MGIAERKEKQKADRERRIIAAARQIAERDGWEAVTSRRLAQEIEYSQPVLYSHFESRDAIVAAVAIEGFRSLTQAIQAAAQAAAQEAEGRNVPEAVAHSYLAFARNNPALYEAMFTLPTSLRFAEAGARPEMREAFAALKMVAPPTSDDVELVTETLWSALHGLADLERAGRIRGSARAERIRLLVRSLLAS